VADVKDTSVQAGDNQPGAERPGAPDQCRAGRCDAAGADLTWLAGDRRRGRNPTTLSKDLGGHSAKPLSLPLAGRPSLHRAMTGLPGRQGERGGGCRHVPGLRPLTTSVHSRRCASGAGIHPGPGIGPDPQTLRPRSATVTQAISSRSWRQHWQFAPSHPASRTAALSRRPPAQPPRACTSVAGPSRSRPNSAASSPRHNISNSTAYFAARFHAPHY
jgi:hypothetical protein